MLAGLDAPADFDDAHEIAGLLFGAAELTRQRFQRMCEQHDLTPVQARALMALAQPAPMRALADILRCDPSNVTGIADRLEDRGLITRVAAPGDRRVKLLASTSAGDGLRRKLERALRATSPFLRSLTDRERADLKRLLAKMQSSNDA